MKKNTLALLMVTSLGLFTANSFANSNTGKLQVQVNVQSSCVLNTATVGGTTATTALLDFGNIQNLVSDVKADTSTSGSGLTVLCSPGTSYSLNFNGGQNYVGNQRRMKADTGSNFIAYNLYGANNTPIPIDDSSSDGTKSVFKDRQGTGAAEQIVVYGVIPATGQIPVPGKYTDTVTVNVVF